jgi:hypothetical protein
MKPDGARHQAAPAGNSLVRSAVALTAARFADGSKRLALVNLKLTR